MTDSNLSSENEKLKNTGIRDIPRVLKEKLFDNTGGIMFPEQIQSKTVEDYESNIENVLRPKGQKDDQLLRGGLSGTFDLTENAINFAGRVIGGISGNKYTAKDYFDNEALGIYIPEEDENSLTYNLSKFGVQYGVPYTAAFKLLGAAGLSNWVWKDVIAGGTTASVFFDTFDKNLSNYVQDTPLANPVTKLLAAESEEESNVAKETIKKFIEGGVTQKIVNTGIDAALNPKKVADAFVNIVEVFKKSPQATKRAIFNINQSKFNKFSNIRKFNGMDEALSKGDDLIDIAPVADDVVTKTPTQIDLPDTRGQGKFYHGTAQEIPDGRVTSVDSGDNIVDSNLYGNGFYTTEDLTTASKYQKKGKKQFLKPEIPIGKGIKRESDLPYGIQSDLKKLNITDEELNQLVRPGIEVPSPDRLKDLANQARQFPIDNQFSGGGRTNVEAFNKIADRLDELAANPPKAPEFRPVTYEITEKQPVKFIDADQQIGWTDDTPEAKLIKKFLEDTGEGGEVLDAWEKSQSFSYGDIVEDLKDIYQREAISKGEFTNLLDDLNLELSRIGYGGVTHQGGNLAGKGKRLHQVKIYWDAENQIDINKVNFDQFGTVADDVVLTPRKKIRSTKGKQKFQQTDKPVGIDDQNFNIFSDNPEDVARIKAAYQNELDKFYPTYSRQVTDDMLIEDADDYLEQEVITELAKFSKEYGLKLPVLMAATVRRITGLAVNLSDGAKLIKTLPIGSQEANILKQKLTIQTINFYRMIVGDKKLGSVVARSLRSRQLANAPNPVTGQAPGEVTASNIQARRAEDVKGGGSEVIRDVAEDIESTFKSLDFTQDDVLKALENDNFEEFADFASKLAAAHGDPFVLSKLVKDSIGMKGLKITNEVFINGILSNPATHARNTLGTMLNVITGPADLVVGSVSRQGFDPILFRRAMAEFAMFKQAQKDALKFAGQAFKDNRNILDKSRMVVDSGNDPTQRFAIQMRGGSFDGEGLQKIKSGADVAKYIRKGLVPDLINGVGTTINAPGRALLTEDEYNKQIAFRMFLKGELVEDGLRRGLTGKSFDDYVDKSFDLAVDWIGKKGADLDLSLKEITDFKPFIGPNGEQVAVGQDLFIKIRDSLDYAADRTFTTRIDNKFVNAFKHPGWKPLLPFINSPLNIQQTLLKRTPGVTAITGKIPLLEGMLDTHRKQLQSASPSVSARAKGVTRIGGGVWVTMAGLSMLAANKFAKIALVDGSDPDWRQDKIRKYSGDIGYAFRILLTNPVTKEPQLGPDGQPKYYFLDCGKIGAEPFSSICRVAGWYGTYRQLLDDDDQKNMALVMTTALARDILDIPMLEAVEKFMDIIENRPDALPNFLANYMNSAFIPYVSLRKALKKTDYSYIDPRSGKKLRGYFRADKSIQKGDYIKQNIRTKFDDGTSIPEDHPAYGTLVTESPRFIGDFFTRKVALKFMKEFEASNPFAERLRPEKFWLTGQNIEYPKNVGINSGMNPSLEGASMNDPVVSLVKRSKSKITKPPAHLFKNSAEGGILLNTTQYKTLLDSISEIKLDDNGLPSNKGKTVYQRLFPIAKNKTILETLDFIESGEVDDDFNIDTKAVLTSRSNSVKDLRKLIRDIVNPYIAESKLLLFQLEDKKGGAKSLLPAYLREKRRQALEVESRYAR